MPQTPDNNAPPKTTLRNTIAAVAAGILLAGYPLLVWSGLRRGDARSVALELIGATALLALLASSRAAELLPLLARRFGALIVVAAAAAAWNDPLALKVLPILTQSWLLWVFASSLGEEHSLVEQFAIRMHERFPDFLLPYCRKVTIAWCVFFATSAVVYVALALWAPLEVWALATSVVAYVIIAAGVLGEYVFHKLRFRFYEDNALDRIWARAFPAECTELGRRTLAWQQQQQQQQQQHVAAAGDRSSTP